MAATNASTCILSKKMRIRKGAILIFTNAENMKCKVSKENVTTRKKWEVFHNRLRGVTLIADSNIAIEHEKLDFTRFPRGFSRKTFS